MKAPSPCWITVLFCCLFGISFADAVKKEGSSLDVIKAFFLGKYDKADDTAVANPQPMHVIGAGLPRTGTLSFTLAMERLGLKSYHMKDGVMETPGHLQLWYDFNVQETKSWEDVAEAIASRGFNASCVAPTCFYYRELLNQYPNSKVVLTVRSKKDASHAWTRSFSSSILGFMRAMEEIPFSWTTRGQQMLQWFPQLMNERLFEEDYTLKDLRPSAKLHDEILPHAYDNWVAKVKATVPRDRLLVFAAKDGYEPLCEFLSPLSPIIQENCEGILKSNEAYPRANDKAKVAALQFSCKVISLTFQVGIPLLVFALFARFFLSGRRGPHSKTKSH